MNEWNPQAHEIFLEAIKYDSAEQRCAYLDDVCGENAHLRTEVESLLEAETHLGSFLETPLVELAPAALRETSNDSSEDSLPDREEVRLDFLGPCEKSDCLGQIAQYEITQVVGRGGMGMVLKGHDTKLNRVVAIKVLAPELASNVSARARFLREAQAAAAVSHDHVVTIHAVDEHRLPFLVMEYVDGESLQQKINAAGPLELKEILRIGMQIAAGLAAAHEQGLIHRDVKPSNVLLENGVERLKLTDFGLARAVDDISITRTGEVAGTPEYMSPEQADGKTVDHRSDLFNLGGVLYAMCTG
jgi:serine/threonine protein kinase